SSYFREESIYYHVPTVTLMQEIIADIENGKSKGYIASKFHYSLVCLVGIIAKKSEVNKICFSGGVFQNSLLVDWVQNEYCKKYDLNFHRKLSPNDENISFGQMVYHDNNITSTSSTTNKETEFMIYNAKL
ncbi:MAG: carbamoyltransferase HypF, partial [Bacillota bacterium]|nr:carbamoyltransferase HypF [Bacillota bacterium]